ALPRRAHRRRHSCRLAPRLRQPLPGAARRAGAVGVRRVHARGCTCRAVPLGGAAAEAPRGGHPAPPAAAAAVARTAGAPHDRLLAAAADARARDRHRAAAARRRARRRTGGGDRAHVDRLRRDPRDAARGASRGVPRARRLRARDPCAARARRRALRMTLQLVGLSHQVAPVELRERVALDLDAAAELAHSLGDAVCLSTCNRTEVYSTVVPEADVVAALESLAGHGLDGVLYTRLEDEAALHLFRVAAG